MAIFNNGGFGNPGGFGGFGAFGGNSDFYNQNIPGNISNPNISPALEDPEKYSVNSIKKRLRDVDQFITDAEKGELCCFDTFSKEIRSLPVILEDKEPDDNSVYRTLRIVTASPVELCLLFGLPEEACQFSEKYDFFNRCYKISETIYEPTPANPFTGKHPSEDWRRISFYEKEHLFAELILENKKLSDRHFEKLANWMSQTNTESFSGYPFSPFIITNDTVKPFSYLTGLERMMKYPGLRKQVSDDVIDSLLFLYAVKHVTEDGWKLSHNRESFIERIRKLPAFQKDVLAFWRQVPESPLSCSNNLYQSAFGSFGEKDNSMSVFREYKKIWKACSGEKTIFDMTNENFRDWISFSVNGGLCFYDDEEGDSNNDSPFLKVLLSLCDGVIWPEKMTPVKQLNCNRGKELILTKDSELLRLALAKNYVSEAQTKSLIKFAIEKKLSAMIPLLILKQNGEWTPKSA
ncbi:MAG: hypothetical protein K5770_15190 [Lachnospiraceae bacterium]|nr:hypothetical protein [Lachnospiraceae bacterium]